jgi:hypothetical protein
MSEQEKFKMIIELNLLLVEMKIDAIDFFKRTSDKDRYNKAVERIDKMAAGVQLFMEQYKEVAYWYNKAHWESEKAMSYSTALTKIKDENDRLKKVLEM